MCPPGWTAPPLMLAMLFFRLLSSAPSLPLQISSSSSFPLLSHGGASSQRSVCSKLRISPSALVVRFGDPAEVNCSSLSGDFSRLGWEVSSGVPYITEEPFLVWRVEEMTDWNIQLICYTLSDLSDQCYHNLSVVIYKPPDSVSISFVNHTGPMLEGHQYTLECTVRGAAPAQSLVVTFYRGQKPLGVLNSDSIEKMPVNESFSLNIYPSKEDDGVQYWCEAKLQLGPAGPQPHLEVKSQKVTATVLPPSLPLQISPPSSVPLMSPAVASSQRSVCSKLRISPSALVVRFGDPAEVNCSSLSGDFSRLGWEVSSGDPLITAEPFLVWRVEEMTDWNIQLICYTLSDLSDQCYHTLSVVIYKPPDSVSISFVNHTGPMLEGHQYTLECTVRGAAPAQSLVVTFYRGQKPLGVFTSDSREKMPVNESFSLNIYPSKEDDGVQYWCEAKLQLGPAGPQPPLEVKSQKVTASVLYGPLLLCPKKLHLRVGQRLGCNIRGNPRPKVTWIRDGQPFIPSTNVSQEHAGKYTVVAEGLIGLTNCTVEVEVLNDGGNTSSIHFLVPLLLLQTLHFL